jgi:hypothetical protein
MSTVLDTYGAAIAAILGGLGVRMLDKMLTKRSETFLEATKIRDELRSENTLLRRDLEFIEVERNEWREKYYAAVEAHINDMDAQHVITEKLDIIPSGSTG